MEFIPLDPLPIPPIRQVNVHWSQVDQTIENTGNPFWIFPQQNYLFFKQQKVKATFQLDVNEFFLVV